VIIIRKCGNHFEYSGVHVLQWSNQNLALANMTAYRDSVAPSPKCGDPLKYATVIICRRRHIAAASGQRQCCDPRRIDADLLLTATIALLLITT